MAVTDHVHALFQLHTFMAISRSQRFYPWQPTHDFWLLPSSAPSEQENYTRSGSHCRAASPRSLLRIPTTSYNSTSTSLLYVPSGPVTINHNSLLRLPFSCTARRKIVTTETANSTFNKSTNYRYCGIALPLILRNF